MENLVLHQPNSDFLCTRCGAHSCKCLLNPAVKLKMGPSLEAGAYHLEQLHAKYGKEQYFYERKI